MVGVTLRAGVVGAGGRMGGWFIHHLRGIGYEVEAVDTRDASLELAGTLDLAVISVPINATPSVIRAIAPRMMKGAVLAEITSIKRLSHMVLTEASHLGVTPLCIHPMFGPSTGSLRGRVVAVIHVGDAEAEYRLAGQLFPGTDLIALDAEHHDRCMAVILSLPYALNLAFARVIVGEDIALASRMAGSTFALQYTLAQSVAGESPALIRDLLRENTSLEPLLGSFTASLEELLEASSDERRFNALHAEIVETLSRDPSYSRADARRQRVHHALTNA
jgi:prephenate dehydrogenase